MGNRDLASFFGAKCEEFAEEERGVACLNGTVDGHLIESELSVEVKGVVERYSGDGRVGRVRIWRRQHQQLQEEDGVYLIVVYSVDARPPVVHDRFVHHSSLDAIMEEHGYSWFDAQGHGMRSEQTQIPWHRSFPELELSSRE